MASGHNANFAALLRRWRTFADSFWPASYLERAVLLQPGDYMTKSGQLVTGDIPVFFAQLLTVFR
ncbi:MAG: hypothetical protein ACLR9W_03230 [Enterobacter hormaechei]